MAPELPADETIIMNVVAPGGGSAGDVKDPWVEAAKPNSSYRAKMLVDGQIDWSDFVRLIDGVAKERNIKPDSPEYKMIEDTHKIIFSSLWSPSKDLSGSQTFEEMLSTMINFHSTVVCNNKEVFLKMIPIGPMFSLYDEDGDGIITLEEFKTFWRAHGIDTTDADQVFAEMDADGNGTASMEEFCDFIFLWCTTPHANHKGANLWGILNKA